MRAFADHDIVASFVVGKPVSLLQDNILQLEQDIFEEIGVPFTEVGLLLISFFAFYHYLLTNTNFIRILNIRWLSCLWIPFMGQT